MTLPTNILQELEKCCLFCSMSHTTTVVLYILTSRLMASAMHRAPTVTRHRDSTHTFHTNLPLANSLLFLSLSPPFLINAFHAVLPIRLLEWEWMGSLQLHSLLGKLPHLDDKPCQWQCRLLFLFTTKAGQPASQLAHLVCACVYRGSGAREGEDSLHSAQSWYVTCYCSACL